MKCPKCGENMVPGEVVNNHFVDVFWLPKTFFEKSLLGVAWPFKKAIKKNEGMIIKTHNNVSEASRSYGCLKCKLVIVECE